jgi:transposase InsO family protein
LHANARLNLHGRRLLIDRIQQGRPIAHVADELGISRQTAYKWWGRWRREGDVGLADRSSRPRSFPTRTSRQLERRVEVLRRKRKLGPARIAGILDLSASTVHQVLCRQGLNRLAWMDRPSGTVIRRQIIHDRPGELVQIDIKKLGRIPPGGGWRAWGRGNVVESRATKVGYAFVHTAIDSHTRLAYSEVLPDEKAVTAIGFAQRALAWFADLRISVEVVQTDNGSCYKAFAFTAAIEAIGARHRQLPPRRPQWNGKVERFNRTLLDEWAYVRVYRSEHARTAALDRWLHLYNHHRAHTSLQGHPPMSRVNNLPGQHT